MTKTERKEALISFIKDNGLDFTYGQRNTNCTIISGYALHLGVHNADEVYNAIKEAVKKEYTEEDYVEDELNRVFRYAESCNYGDFWKSDLAKKQYKF